MLLTEITAPYDPVSAAQVGPVAPGAPPADAPFAAGPTPAPPAPVSVGWAGAAMAVRGVHQIARPMLLGLTPDGHGTIAIDPRYHLFVWSTPLSEFPVDPGVVDIATYPLAPDAPSLAGRTLGLDPLLWLIGLHAFGGRRAPWLRAGDKYRLRRWPDFDVLPADDEQVHIIRSSVKSLARVDKLARIAGVEQAAAQAVVNALSLMGALRRLAGKEGAPAIPMPAGEYDLPDRPRGRHVKRGG